MCYIVASPQCLYKIHIKKERLEVNIMERMTKKDYFNELRKVVLTAGVENENELVDFIDKQVELLSKKSNVKTKAQKENEVIVEKVYEALVRIAKPVTVSELQADAEMAEYSNQKLSALLKKLVDTNRVVKTQDKKKSYFSVDAE
jgi:hypothetical protein